MVHGIERVNTLVDGLVHAAGLAALLAAFAAAAAGDVFEGVLFDVIHWVGLGGRVGGGWLWD